ncbi:MAG TPA: ATP-dependent DNA helicase RecG [Gemmataceae bacterium]|jgi:ATP-dependent DNA helicase RecG|nr:ATP-dependent DNA helicase RecG [Gemmataceae bacterium]
MSPEMPQSPGDDPLRQSAQYLKGVGPTRYELLRRLGLETVGDLLFHFPRSYEDLSDVRPVAQLSPGTLQTARGEVVEIEGRQLADGRTVVSVVLSDGGQCLEGVWFNQPYASRRFRYGQMLTFSGKPKRYRGHWQMVSPRVQVLGDAADGNAPGIVPVYPATEDLRQEHLRPLLRRVAETFAGHVPEGLPPELRRERCLPEVRQALHDIHSPLTLAAAQAARRRFVYEEFLVLQLAMALRRRELRDRQRAPVLRVSPKIDTHIRRLFPFRLTADQDRAVADICRDLASERPMQRLLQADVGAGKTAVAVYALLVAVANQHQTVLMAPTEVLAQQHWRTLGRYLEHSRVRRLLLTGALTGSQRRAALQGLRGGEVDLVVGTHALLQEDVQFARLGLVVIDEQHKFGVNQRARVRRLGPDPHYLVMTATPIPRSVALTVFGDLDLSVIRELPPGRQPVLTRWVQAGQRERVYQRLRDGLCQGRQAYVVCPLVSESDSLDLKAAAQTHAELQAGPFRDFRVGLIHGALDDRRKDVVMEQFCRRELDLLVSTSVVEVGIDVPNATLLVIEHAERFGLSQLHQLRGRVSRGDVPGECYLFADPAGDEAQQRLRVLVRTTDGFALAEKDAELRGLGEVFGTRQHGLGELRVGDLIADHALLQTARRDAIAIVAADPGLRRDEHALLRRTVLERYGRTLDLAEIG